MGIPVVSSCMTLEGLRVQPVGHVTKGLALIKQIGRIGSVVDHWNAHFGTSNQKDRLMKHRKALLAMALASSALAAMPAIAACGEKCGANKEPSKCAKKDSKCAKK